MQNVTIDYIDWDDDRGAPEDLNGKMGYLFGKVGSGRYITIAGIVEPDGRLIILTVSEMQDSNRISYQSYFHRRQLV